MFNRVVFTYFVLFMLLNSVNGYCLDDPDRTEKITYKQIDGIELHLLYYLPDGYENRQNIPALVLFHGGGWIGGSTDQFAEQASEICDHGMVVVLAEYRLSNNHKSTPFQSVEDAKSAMRYVRHNAEKFHIDPNMIAAGGGSAGGHLAAACAVVEKFNGNNEPEGVSPVPNALILINPVIDNSPQGYGYERIGDRWPEFSPLHNIDKQFPPTLFLTGTKDHLLPVNTCLNFKEKVIASGSKCELIFYQDAGHGFFNKNRNLYYYRNTLDRMKHFLRSLGYIN